MAEIKVDIQYQPTVYPGASGFFISRASGIANIRFSDDYIVDIDQSLYPISTFTHLRVSNQGDRDILGFGIEANQHNYPNEFSQDPDQMKMQYGTASETYNSMGLRILDKEDDMESLVVHSGIRNDFLWESVFSGAQGISFNESPGQGFGRNWAKNTYSSSVSPVLRLASCRDYDEDALDFVANGQFDDPLGDDWHVSSSGTKVLQTASGVLIYAGKTADTGNPIHQYLYGVFQTWDCTPKSQLSTGRPQRLRFNWEDSGSVSAGMVSGVNVSGYAFNAPASGYLQNIHFEADSKANPSGFEYALPGAPDAWLPLPSTGFDPVAMSGGQVRYTMQTPVPYNQFKYRIRQKDWTDNTSYHGHINILTDYFSFDYDDPTPTTEAWDPELSVTGNTQHFDMHFCDANDSGAAYRVTAYKTDTTATLHYHISGALDPFVVASGDVFSYKVMADPLSVDPSGFYATLVFTDSSELTAASIPRATSGFKWEHVSYEIPGTLAGKTIDHLELRFEAVGTDTGFVQAWFNHAQVMNKSEWFRGRQFRLEVEMAQLGAITGTETPGEAAGSGHAFFGPYSSANTDANGHGFVMALIKYQYPGDSWLDLYAFIDTSQLSGTGVKERFVQYMGFPGDPQVYLAGICAGFFGSNTADNGAALLVSDIKLEPMCQFLARGSYTLDQATGDSDYSFRAVDQYGEKAWALEWTGQYYD